MSSHYNNHSHHHTDDYHQKHSHDYHKNKYDDKYKKDNYKTYDKNDRNDRKEKDREQYRDNKFEKHSHSKSIGNRDYKEKYDHSKENKSNDFSRNQDRKARWGTGPASNNDQQFNQNQSNGQWGQQPIQQQYQPYQQNSWGQSNNNYNNSSINQAQPQFFGSKQGINSGFQYSNNQNPQKLPNNHPSVLGKNLKKIDWNSMRLEKFKRVFYQENITDKQKEEGEKYRRDHLIFIKSEGYAPMPFMTWKDAIMSSFLMKEIKKQDFEKPTTIQAQAWPIQLMGQDFIGIAQTGSGKTLAYICPAIQHLTSQPPLKYGEGPIVLILAPTRELAQQIEEQCRLYGVSHNLKTCIIYGGSDKYPQKQALKRGCDILVATPGRLIDFVEANVMNLFKVTYLILDEADRMLDMGFEPQLRCILSQIRPDRQTSFWSATWPKQVQKLAYDISSKAVHIQIGEYEELCINKNITQHVSIVPSRFKKNKLIEVMKNQIEPNSKILIFCKQKKGADQLSRQLQYEGYDNISIHGDKSQKDRNDALDKYKQNKVNILVATDVVARGLDISDIEYVINYDFPMVIEDYIHRIGRTGRAGNKGASFTFFCEEDERLIDDLINILKDAHQHIDSGLLKIQELKQEKYKIGKKNLNKDAKSMMNEQVYDEVYYQQLQKKNDSSNSYSSNQQQFQQVDIKKKLEINKNSNYYNANINDYSNAIQILNQPQQQNQQFQQQQKQPQNQSYQQQQYQNNNHQQNRYNLDNNNKYMTQKDYEAVQNQQQFYPQQIDLLYQQQFMYYPQQSQAPLQVSIPGQNNIPSIPGGINLTPAQQNTQVQFSYFDQPSALEQLVNQYQQQQTTSEQQQQQQQQTFKTDPQFSPVEIKYTNTTNIIENQQTTTQNLSNQ